MTSQRTRIQLAFMFSLLALALARPSSASAAPFSAKMIPAQADGIIHLDVEKLRTSKLWRMVRDQLPPEAKPKAQTQSELGTDILSSLQKLGDENMASVAMQLLSNTRSITVWATDNDNWAAIIDLPLAGLMMNAIDSASGIKSITQDGIRLYKLGDDAFVSVSGNILVISQSKKAALVTAKVHRGKGKSLNMKRLGRLDSSASKGIILVAGFGGKLIEEFKKKAASSVFKVGIRSVLFFAGESKGNFFAQADAALDSANTATNLASVATGLIGMVALSEADPEVRALAQSVRITTTDAVLQARIEVPMSTLATIVAKP